MAERKEIDTSQLLPEERFNLLLMIIAQELDALDMGQEFILLCKHPKGGWSVHTTLLDVTTCKDVLRKMSEAEPYKTEVRAMQMEDFVTDGSGGPRRTRQ